ncbi:MAG: hypothetical protein AAGA29_10240 [Planctomycetota bacterium]
MKRIILGLLLTGAAGLAGLVCGALLVILFGVLLFGFGPAAPSPAFNTLTNIAGVGLPILFGLAGVAVGWYALMREPERDRQRLGETPLCPHCDYNLSHNTTDRCPECGRPISSSQQQYLDRETPRDL